MIHQAKQIARQTNETVEMITAVLKIHLNVNQNTTINTPAVFTSLETQPIESLFNKTITPYNGTRIQLPMKLEQNLNLNNTVSFRVSLLYVAYGIDRFSLNFF